MDFPIFSDYSKKIPRKGSGLYYDPLYGYVPLPSYCREAMDLEVFQRLRGIKQLSTVYLTFPGALHTRFDHCVGTSHLASIMFNKLRELVNPGDTNAPKINHITEACMQLSSLFHDTGHGPFGHIFEMFCKRREKFRKWRHEEFSRKLITGKDKRSNELKGREFKQIPEFLNKLKSAFQKKYGKVENLSLLDPPNIYKIGYGKSPDLGSKKLNNKYDFLKDIIASSYGLDRLDYLKRDAYFSGVNTGNIDIGEIISSLLLYRFENKYQLFLKTDAAPALEALLQARNLVYRRLYHNNVNRSAQELIIRGLIELACNPEDVCLLTDNELLYRFFNDGDFPVEINERIKFRILFENLEICNHSFIRKFEEGLKDYVEKPDKWLVLKSKEDSIAKKVDMDKGKVFYDIEVIPAVRGEVLGLRWNDIDFVNYNMHLKKTKSGKDRIVPMNSLVAATLKKQDMGSEFVFPHPQRKDKALKDVSYSLKTACDKIGIEKFRFHDLRHTAATFMVQAGVDLVTIKEILGHSTIQMTMIYCHSSQEAKRKAVQELEKAFGTPRMVRKEEEMVRKW